MESSTQPDVRVTWGVSSISPWS